MAGPAWWLGAAALTVTVGWVFVVVTADWIAVVAAAIAAALCAALLLSWGGPVVGFAAGALWAGRAHLPLDCCGTATALDADATRRLRGPDADARAFLLLRPWISTSVRVDVDDERDPAPYWLVSTRHPARIVATLAAAKGKDSRSVEH